MTDGTTWLSIEPGEAESYQVLDLGMLLVRDLEKYRIPATAEDELETWRIASNFKLLSTCIIWKAVNGDPPLVKKRMAPASVWLWTGMGKVPCERKAVGGECQ